MAFMMRLKHPRHGKKTAYIVQEAETDIANGWAEDFEGVPGSNAFVTPQKQPAKKKRGRKRANS